MINPLADLAEIAESQIGHHEDGDSNTGSQIVAYQKATKLGAPASVRDGYPWCCAFVVWCIEQFLKTHPGVLSFPPSLRPTMASVAEFVSWAKETNQYIFYKKDVPQPVELQAGDIVAFQFPTGHHIGIVTGRTFSGPQQLGFPTVEGNTSGPRNADGSQRDGGEVAAKMRGFLNVVAFIRLSVEAQAA